MTTSLDGSCSSSDGRTKSEGGGGGAVDVEGPAWFDDDASAALSGVGIVFDLTAEVEDEDADELVVTVVNGVISPGEYCWLGPRKDDRVSSGVCVGLG